MESGIYFAVTELAQNNHEPSLAVSGSLLASEHMFVAHTFGQSVRFIGIRATVKGSDKSNATI